MGEVKIWDMQEYKNAPSKNATVIISTLLIFVTSLFTYIVTNVDIPFIQDDYIWIIVIILGTINVVCGCFPLIYFFSLGGQNWIIKQFIVILFNTFFSSRLKDIKERYPNQIDQFTYRITYYKFYRKKSFSLKLQSLQRKIQRNKYGEQRQININHDYLLCEYRYGIENGRYDTHKTTKPYELYSDEKMLKGVTSCIYRGNERIYVCIDNFSINDIVEKIIKNKRNLSLYDKSYSEQTLDNNITAMEELIDSFNKLWFQDADKEISSNEKKELIDFMRNTHTDYNDIFDISGGTHSNHFLGFKVYNQKHEAIGVFIIDAKEPNPSSFEEIMFNNQTAKSSQTSQVINSDKKWIEEVLKTFSNLTSKSIFELNSDKEDKHGQRIGN